MTLPNKKYKIALVGYTLDKGGLEKVISNLSVMFGKNGFEVHNVILQDSIEYPFLGTLLNVEKECRQFPFRKLAKYIYLFFYFRKHKFDYILDFRYRLNVVTEIVFSKIIYNAPTIYSVQSSKIDTYFPENPKITKFIYSNNFKVICGSNGIKRELEKKHSFSNVQTIYNPISFDKINDWTRSQTKVLPFEYILAVGRFENENIKQFDKLIATYKSSNLRDRNIHLVILGDGETLESFKKTNDADEFIHLMGFQQNPYIFMKQARFFVLCSKYEGFGMVLAEALACGCPVISFDCPTGPNEIIRHEENGLLIPNQDFEALKVGMEKLCSDKKLLDLCKGNAKSSVQKFEVKECFSEWVQIFNSK